MPPALNGSNGLMRMHWSKKTKLKEQFQFLILVQSKKRFSGKVKVTLKNYAIALMDWDNLASRFKLIGDALEKNGQLLDDSPKTISEFYLEQHRVRKKDQVRLEVIIEAVGEGLEPSM